MSDPKSHDISEIETLLANRQQLVEWLERLDASGSRAPESVRSKVRADYQGRLGQVVAQLSTHRDVIAETLEGLRSQSREIAQLRQEETDIRSEAELRHAVGEYSDDEWQLVELESSGKIAGFDHEIDRLSAEIGRLEEVQELLVPTREVRPAAAPAPEPVTIETGPELRLEPSSSNVEPSPEAEAPSAPAPRPEAPRFVPRGGHFPRETVIPSRAPRAAAPAPAPAPSPAPAATITTGNRDDELAFLRSMNVEILTPSPRSPVAPPNGGEGEAKAGAPVPKTLKCGDCGSLNRPTDWYCERCGAELAAV
jgi:hypothetical protein